MGFWKKGREILAKAVGLKIRHSQDRYGEFLSSHVRERDRWLDIGCGRQIVPDWALPVDRQRSLLAKVDSLVGIDVDKAILEHPLLTQRVFALADPMPFADNSFDLVTANMVMEHIREPLRILAEIRRVLTPGGRFIFHTPNRRYYLVALSRGIPRSIKVKLIPLVDARPEEDVFPAYYCCNTTEKIRQLAGASGFQVEELIVGGSVGAFSRLGPIGWLEIFALKLLTLPGFSRFNTTIIAMLVKPGEPRGQ